MNSVRRISRRLASALALMLGLSVLFMTAASAHVEVSGDDATQGGFGVITFRVPSESATASTVELTITMPATLPFASVAVQPKDGWTVTTTSKPLNPPEKDDDGREVDEYVATIDYKATTGGIPAGQLDLFNLNVGAFPDADSVTFEAQQTYSDGSIVNWNEPIVAGKDEPDNPTPVLSLAPSEAASPSTSSSASWTGITGLILGAAALILSIGTLIMVRGSTRARQDPSPGA